MQYKYLLILRYSLINLVGLIFLFVLITQGYVTKAIKADITNMVTVILTLFAVGFILAAYRTFWLSRELNYSFFKILPNHSLAKEFLQSSKKLDASSRNNLAASLRIKLSSKIGYIKFMANTLVILGLILRLVGVEYDLQKKEAAYRKILVIAEDDGTIRPKTINELFEGVRSIHYLSYLRYLYFNIGRIAYLQANVLSAYVFLAPAIVAGAVTLGVMQQIIRAFGRVEGSMQYILKAWPTIIELASVYKRLREFEYKIKQDEFIREKI